MIWGTGAVFSWNRGENAYLVYHCSKIMAFASKLGNLLRQSKSKHTSFNGSTSMPSIYQALRHMSSSRLFVAGLSYAIDEQFLKESFTEFGEITEARIIYDWDSGRSRGFGFISFTSDEEAASALKSMDGKQLSGRILHVNYANERRSGFGGGGYGQNDGYASGGGYNRNDGYGTTTAYSQNNNNDQYGNGGGYSQSQSEYGSSGGFGDNDGHGSGTVGMVDGDIGYDNESGDNVGNMGKG
ncbi:glycine-rich RNA-binding protein 4, mitochondrial isoform X1 [Cryptomeria japonica]|uniref:glycine-rich RNA-binding protein 4, mitochondrial isoform X1 n=2 Tax=Cryptomeria japonica TaxID=3369 RepID=UPI0027DA7744|nr:glycine-rich RNA-binding protein 4, mitochondrial isoform X1 [Cryptomeria japonica]